MPEIEAIPYSSRSEHMKVAEPQYKPQHGEPVEWPTDEPLKEGEVEYQGHCHCGAVRYVLRHKPLSEWTVNDCNCSVCFKVCSFLLPSLDSMIPSFHKQLANEK